MKEFPSRLSSEVDAAGHVVRHLAEPPAAKAELSYKKLLQIRKQRLRRQAALAASVGASAVALVLHGVPIAPSIRAEAELAQVVPPISAEAPNYSSASLQAEPDRAPVEGTGARRLATGTNSLQELGGSDRVPGSSVSHPRAADRREPDRSLLTQRSEAPSAARDGFAGTGLAACADRARAGAIDDASQCYATVAAGEGISAELAALEQARLWRRARGDSAKAEQLLQGYLSRFPQGALRHEARLMRVHLLAQQNRHEELLSEVSQITEAGLLPERRAELTSLKATTLAKLGRCDGAFRSLDEMQYRTAELRQQELDRIRRLCAAE